MQVACRCGQAFTIAQANFPFRVACHVCGWHFLVFDSGEVFDISPKLQFVDLTAFQATLTHSFQKAPTTEICTDETIERFEEAKSETERIELAAIDLLWTLEREGFNLIPFSGLQVMPTRGLAIGIGLTAAICWFLLWILYAAMAMATSDFGILCQSGYLLPAVFAPVFLFKQAREFEAAEEAWMRRRLAIVKRRLAKPAP